MIDRETKMAQNMKHPLTLLLATTSQQSTRQGFVADLFLFLLRYPFLLNNASKTQNSRGLKTPQLNAPQGNIYMGARYLDPKYSRWISTDPALGEYIPAAGKANAKDMANLPGMGGIFNHTNAGLFHYAGNCPVRYIDPDGRFWDTVWDLYSLGVGIKSFINNVKEGDVLGAVMDGAGIIADAAAVAMPFVPGGASCAVKTARAVATGIAGAGEVAAGAKNVYEGVRDGDTLQVLDGTVQIVSGANTVKGSAGKLAEGLCFIAGTLTLTDDGLALMMASISVRKFSFSCSSEKEAFPIGT